LQSEPFWLLAETENGKSRHLGISKNCWKLLITHAHVEASMASAGSASYLGYRFLLTASFCLFR
jgi:hypothetical protein